MSTSVTPEPTAPAPVVPPAVTAAPPAVTPAPGAATTPRFDPDVVIEELIESKGGGYQGARLAALKLLRDKGKLLEKVTNLRARVAEEGSVVLKGDALATYNKLTGLGLTPEQIIEKMQQHAVLQNEVKAAKQDRFFDEVAESMGFSGKGKKVFSKLAKMNGIEIEVRDIDVKHDDGTTTKEKKPFARLATDTKGEFKPLDMYLDEEFGEFRPALYAEDDDSDAAASRSGDSGSSRGHAQERKVTPMATQSGSSRRTADRSERGVVERVLASTYGPRKPAT